MIKNYYGSQLWNPDSTRRSQLPLNDLFGTDWWCFTSEDAYMRLCLLALVANNYWLPTFARTYAHQWCLPALVANILILLISLALIKPWCTLASSIFNTLPSGGKKARSVNRDPLIPLINRCFPIYSLISVCHSISFYIHFVMPEANRSHHI